MGVPENPEPQGSPRLLTVPEITERYGISRQAIHTYRQRGVFPQPAPEQGSTRLRFREDEVEVFFAANPKRPGRRTDRDTATEGEQPVPDTEVKETVTVPKHDLEVLLAVATAYVDAFTDDDRMSLGEAFRHNEVIEVVEKHGRRY